jgi:hypothetical protein
MTPWLLLIIAALIVGCVSLYFQVRQGESQSLGRQSLMTDELREAEAALLSALEKVRQMDTVLAVRERNLATREELSLPEGRRGAASGSRGLAAVDRGPGNGEDPAAREDPPDAASRGPQAPASDRGSGTEPPRRPARGTGAAGASSAHGPEQAGRPWQDRAVALAGTGMTARQIARELALPVGQVELVLALAPPGD